MAKANRELLGHEGTTDVITFSYLEEADGFFENEIGIELIICADVAKREGDSRADSDYSSEMALYVVHGLLHSAGYDDLTDDKIPLMRAGEKRVMDILKQEFDLNRVFPPAVCGDKQ
jgi:probable rRNA maturation factor